MDLTSEIGISWGLNIHLVKLSVLVNKEAGDSLANPENRCFKAKFTFCRQKMCIYYFFSSAAYKELHQWSRVQCQDLSYKPCTGNWTTRAYRSPLSTTSCQSQWLMVLVVLLITDHCEWITQLCGWSPTQLRSIQKVTMSGGRSTPARWHSGVGIEHVTPELWV